MNSNINPTMRDALAPFVPPDWLDEIPTAKVIEFHPPHAIQGSIAGEMTAEQQNAETQEVKRDLDAILNDGGPDESDPFEEPRL